VWSYSDAASTRFFTQSGDAIAGITTVKNSQIILSSNKFENCRVISSTLGSTGSQGTSSVFGGAVSILQSSLVFAQRYSATPSSDNTVGLNLNVVILDSIFTGCFASTSPSSVLPGAVNGGGGAVYASSAALSNFTLKNSNFTSSYVLVFSGSVGDADVPFYSTGGAVAVEVPGSIFTFVGVTACSFSNCSAQGARVPNLVVRGGAVAVSRAATVVLKTSKFINCKIEYALVDGFIVSGGAGLTAALVANVDINDCEFHAFDGGDSSQTSAGLLSLASDLHRSRTNVTGTSFASSELALSVLCVNAAGIRWTPCSPSTQYITVLNSSITQVAPQQDSFSSLISLSTVVSSSFTKFRMQCVNSTAVFKTISSDMQFVIYFCKACSTSQISLSGSVVFVESLDNVENAGKCLEVSRINICPFGMSNCTTFVNVASGFWTNFTNASGAPLQATRCPPGYCACGSDSCLLPPPLTIVQTSDPLCASNRTGRLCGGCLPDFTQAMDHQSCIPNEICINNLWWVWTVSILGFAAYGLYIVISAEYADTAVSCILFYLQISPFSSTPGKSEDIFSLLQISQISQVRSVVSFASQACYGPNMTAYNAMASDLWGPLFLVSFCMAWAWIFRVLQPWLQQRNIHMEVSYSGTLTIAILYVFSTVATVVFALVDCTSYDSDGVVVIDGTVPCLDSTWKGLTVVVVLLCLFPVAFFAALWWNKLPANARAAVSCNFTEPAFYWEALTLEFRLLISLMQFLEGYANLTSFMRMVLSLGMLCLLMNLRPHISSRTFWVDVMCYACLVAQFGLQSFFAGINYFAVIYTPDQKNFVRSIKILTVVIRSCILPNCCRLCSRSLCSHHLRYLPVPVAAVDWMWTKKCFAKAILCSLRALVLRAKRCIFGGTHELHEMQIRECENVLTNDGSTLVLKFD
jgi:hypothetical protein